MSKPVKLAKALTIHDVLAEAKAKAEAYQAELDALSPEEREKRIAQDKKNLEDVMALAFNKWVSGYSRSGASHDHQP